MDGRHPVNHLHRDHANFLRLLGTLERQLGHVSRPDGERADFELIRDTMSYMTQYPDLLHHPTEDLLADHLLEARPDLAPDLERLRDDHVTLRERGRDFLEAASNVVDGSLAPREDILKRGLSYVDLQRTHMQWEESAFFPQVRAILGTEVLQMIDDTLRAQGDPLFGPIRAAEYEQLWHHIERQAKDGPP